MVRHQERRARHRHNLVAAWALRIHLTARDPLEVRERGLAVRAGVEPCERHGGLLFSRRRQGRLTTSCAPHPTQNADPWRRETACCSSLHCQRGMSRFTTLPHCGQCGTGELARRWFMLSQSIGGCLNAVIPLIIVERCSDRRAPCAAGPARVAARWTAPGAERRLGPVDRSGTGRERPSA
jgi:hypothetical protein